jgi:hypothetical protein
MRVLTAAAAAAVCSSALLPLLQPWLVHVISDSCCTFARPQVISIVSQTVKPGREVTTAIASRVATRLAQASHIAARDPAARWGCSCSS